MHNITVDKLINWLQTIPEPEVVTKEVVLAMSESRFVEVVTEILKRQPA